MMNSGGECGVNGSGNDENVSYILGDDSVVGAKLSCRLSNVLNMCAPSVSSTSVKRVSSSVRGLMGIGSDDVLEGVWLPVTNYMIRRILVWGIHWILNEDCSVNIVYDSEVKYNTTVYV